MCDFVGNGVNPIVNAVEVGYIGNFDFHIMRKICLSAVQTNLNLDTVFLTVVVDQTIKTVRQLCDEIGLEYIDYMSQNTHTIYRASAYQVDDALMAIGNAIYELEDKIHPDLRDDIGVTDALDLLYETYVKAVHYIRDCNYMDDYQKEMLMQKYNLEEAMEVLGGNDFDRE